MQAGSAWGARTATCSCLQRTQGENSSTTRTSLGCLPVMSGVRRGRGKGFPSVSTLAIPEAEEHCTLRVGQGRACPTFRTAVRGCPIELRTQSALRLGTGRVDKDSVGMGQEDHHLCLDGPATVLRAQMLRPQTPLCIRSD